MSNYKNQHYIPQFYLRNFSVDNDQIHIGIYNLSANVFTYKARIKTQASRNFYYGKDGKAEKILTIFESNAAPIVDRILKENKVPKKPYTEFDQLSLFIGLTKLRNPVAIDKNVESFKLMADLLKSKYPETDDKFLSHIRIPEEQAKIIDLNFALDFPKFTKDLDFKLLINNTDIPFISSDHPVIEYNMYGEAKKWFQATNGIGCRGIQIFLPLSPGKLLILYDKWAYKIGDKKRDLFAVDLEGVNQFNLLQVLNCNQNIYFNENISRHYIDNLINKSKNYKRPHQPNFSWSRLIKDNITPDHDNLIISSFSELKINLNVSSITLSKTAKQSHPEQPQDFIRPSAMKLRV